MRPLWTAAEARAFDADIAESTGLPSLLLMENAGWGAFHALLGMCPNPSRVTLVCGPGQNGGDGWVVARLMRAETTAEVVVLTVGERASGDAKLQRDAYERRFASDAPQASAQLELSALRALFDTSDVVVDGLFGTGLSREVVGEARRVIECMNASQAPVLALDIPSGIDADTGARRGVSVVAERTVTFGAQKRGLRAADGVEGSGMIHVASLGFRAADAGACILERSDATISPRGRQMHKGIAGRVGLVAGSPGMSGAAALTARAAFRSGAGVVRLWSRGETHPGFPELMQSPFEDSMIDALRECHACGIGPGLGSADEERARRIILETTASACIDADALRYFARDPQSLRDRPNLVLTPPPGEAAALLGCSAARVEADRYRAAQELADRTGQVVVLKGACSIIASPGAFLRVSPFGSTALATAGSGDVLTGLITALLVHLSPLEAATTGVIVHGLAGERLGHDRGVLASEIADAIPAVMAELQAAAT